MRSGRGATGYTLYGQNKSTLRRAHPARHLRNPFSDKLDIYLRCEHKKSERVRNVQLESTLNGDRPGNVHEGKRVEWQRRA